MERLSRQLELHPCGISRTKLYEATQGRREWLVKGLARLIDERFADDDGSLLRSLRPFREEDAGSPVPKPFPTVADNVAAAGSLVPRP